MRYFALMTIIGVCASLIIIGIVLIDAFEAIVMPRRVVHRFRLARLYYRTGWQAWKIGARCFAPGRRREAYLSLFGPLSLLCLFVLWMFGLILGFALLHWSLHSGLHGSASAGFLNYLYLSGVTASTLGFGDIVPVDGLGRFLTVAESLLGFGFLACVIGYLPAIFQAFSRREVTISLLDARAGSPPSTAQFLLRVAQARNLPAVIPILAEWERWAAELLEGHLSFPVLSYYRSQHDNQSWLATLTSILDTCAFIMAGAREIDPYQAQLTFAMARHAAVDLALVFKTPPLAPGERLNADELRRLCDGLRDAGMLVREDTVVGPKLTELRAMYEPFVAALGKALLFSIPPFVPTRKTTDNWQTTPWTSAAPELANLPAQDAPDGHFT